MYPFILFCDGITHDDDDDDALEDTKKNTQIYPLTLAGDKQLKAFGVG